MQSVATGLTQFKVLELGGQQGLDVLGIAGADDIGAQLTELESGGIAILAGGHGLNTPAGHSGHLASLVHGQRLLQGVDAQQIPGVRGHTPTVPFTGILGMLPAREQHI